jgi:hypothetical protein
MEAITAFMYIYDELQLIIHYLSLTSSSIPLSVRIRLEKLAGRRKHILAYAITLNVKDLGIRSGALDDGSSPCHHYWMC